MPFCRATLRMSRMEVRVSTNRARCNIRAKRPSALGGRQRIARVVRGRDLELLGKWVERDMRCGVLWMCSMRSGAGFLQRNGTRRDEHGAPVDCLDATQWWCCCAAYGSSETFRP